LRAFIERQKGKGSTYTQLKTTSNADNSTTVKFRVKHSASDCKIVVGVLSDDQASPEWKYVAEIVSSDEQLKQRLKNGEIVDVAVLQVKYHVQTSPPCLLQAVQNATQWDSALAIDRTFLGSPRIEHFLPLGDPSRLHLGDALAVTGFAQARDGVTSALFDSSHEVNQLSEESINSGAISFHGGSGGPCLALQGGEWRVVGVLGGPWGSDFSTASSFRRIDCSLYDIWTKWEAFGLPHQKNVSESKITTPLEIVMGRMEAVEVDVHKLQKEMEKLKLITRNQEKLEANQEKLLQLLTRRLDEIVQVVKGTFAAIHDPYALVLSIKTHGGCSGTKMYLPEGKRIFFHGAGFGFDKKNKKDDLRVPFDDEGVGIDSEHLKTGNACFSIEHLKPGNVKPDNVKVQAKENDLHYDGKLQSIDKPNRVIKQGNQGSYLIGESDYLNFRIGDYVVRAFSEKEGTDQIPIDDSSTAADLSASGAC
jgi:hypothetical protein